jgi:hypothetical protein
LVSNRCVLDIIFRLPLAATNSTAVTGTALIIHLPRAVRGFCVASGFVRKRLSPSYGGTRKSQSKHRHRARWLGTLFPAPSVYPVNETRGVGNRIPTHS